MKRPPMNPSEKQEALCRKAEEAAKKVGLSFGWTNPAEAVTATLPLPLEFPRSTDWDPLAARRIPWMNMERSAASCRVMLLLKRSLTAFFEKRRS